MDVGVLQVWTVAGWCVNVYCLILFWVWVCRVLCGYLHFVCVEQVVDYYFGGF